MLEIDLVDLKNNINIINETIKEYEEIKINLFNELKQCCTNWQDGNSIEFDNQIYLEKVETEFLYDNFKDRLDLLEYIYDKYSELGKKVKCNLDNRDTLINSIEYYEEKIQSILNKFSEIDTSFYYPEQNKIFQQKNKILDIKTDLSTIKSSVIKTYENIEKIEKNVKEKITKIEKIKINSFDYELN